MNISNKIYSKVIRLPRKRKKRTKWIDMYYDYKKNGKIQVWQDTGLATHNQTTATSFRTCMKTFLQL